LVFNPEIDVPRKEVLVFADWYLPGHKGGGPIRSIANMISHLDGHLAFSVITRNTDYCDSEPYENISPDEWIDLEGGNQAFYFSKKRLGFKGIKKLLIERPDTDVYLNSMFSWYFTIIPLIILRRQKGRKVILAPRGMLSPGSFGVKKKKKSIFLFFASLAGIYKNVFFQATSEGEIKDITAHGLSKNPPIYAPNLAEKNIRFRQCDYSKEAGKVNLVSIARIAPEKNLLYALKVLNKVKGNVEFDIYGSIYDQDYWAQCKKLIETMPVNIAIKYHGDLTVDSIGEVLESSHFLFMPTTGENFGHIILQSLIASCPPIISDKTPWNKLNVSSAGFSIPLDDQSSWIETVETCIAMGDEQYKQMTRQAGNMAQAYINDPTPVDLNKALFL